MDNGGTRHAAAVVPLVFTLVSRPVTAHRSGALSASDATCGAGRPRGHRCSGWPAAVHSTCDTTDGTGRVYILGG